MEDEEVMAMHNVRFQVNEPALEPVNPRPSPDLEGWQPKYADTVMKLFHWPHLSLRKALA
jgi:hypothetical protein